MNESETSEGRDPLSPEPATPGAENVHPKSLYLF